jgi:hypothetical protein
MVIDNPAYSDWFLPKNNPAEIPLPERTLMALANKPVQPKCQDSDELVDATPDYSVDETPEPEASK